MSPLARLTILLLLPMAVAAQLQSQSKPLVMVVQPINSEESTLASYGPLVDYLAQRCGCEIELRPVGNYLSFWGMTRRDDQFDLVLDAAHMTSYRVEAKGFTVIAKVESVASYTVVTRDDTVFLDTDELMGRRIATLPSPGLGAIRLLQMFPSVTRQPTMVMAENSEEAIQALFSDKVAAAIIPTRLVSEYDGLNVVTTTEQVPSPAFSVSPRVDTETAAALRQALLQLTASEQGQAILASARVPAFEAADNADYEGYHALLNEVWGYDLAVSAR